MISNNLKILIVDDSAFFRHRIADTLRQAEDVAIVGYAANGEDAVKMAHKLNPDLITMDVYMPVVDGISAVRRIMAERPTRILMLSALTREGARETLQALEAGAIDFLPKEIPNLSSDTSKNGFTEKLLEKIRTVGRSRLGISQKGISQLRSDSIAQPIRRVTEEKADRTKLVVIGASTGGPVALQVILSSLPHNFPLPVLVAVHMPSSFTSAFAERLNTICAIEVKEAKDHEPLKAGQVLIAPGGQQMNVEKWASGPLIRVRQAMPGDVYHPSVDQLFLSAAQVYGSQALGLILTGMGSDGLKGGQQLKSSGAKLWSQDEKSCVVYGMPQAIERAGLSDRILPIEEIGPQLIKQL